MTKYDPEATYLCPKCKLAWKRSVMRVERGSWTMEWVARCDECDLADWIEEGGYRRYGKVIVEKSKVTTHD